MKTGIISLGLIGGSLLKVLCAKGIETVAVTRNKDSIEKAKTYTPFVSDDINTLSGCDIIFVCSPMSKTLEILDKLETVVCKDTIVTDVCSLKGFVMQKERQYTFIGSHPMAGTEHSGFDASFEALFEGAKWVITPFESTPSNAVDKLSSLISLTGATTVVTDAKSHDRAAALISHMPMIVAQALVKTVKDEQLAKMLAASGFRDMTRLALSNTQMAADMAAMNSQNISESIIMLMESVKQLLGDDYSVQIEALKDIRQNMYNDKGQNISN